MYVPDVQLGFPIGPDNWGGAILKAVICLLNTSLTGLPYLASVGEDGPSPAET